MNSTTSSRQVAFQLLQQGYEQFEIGEFEAALQSCQAALAIYQTIGDMAGVGYTLSNIANVYRQQAIEYYSQALSTFENNNVQIDDPSIAQSLTAPLHSQPGWYASIDKEIFEADNGDPDGRIVRLESQPPVTTDGGDPDNGDSDNGDLD